MTSARAQLYLHTLLNLRPTQVLGRVWKVVHTTHVDDSPAPATRPSGIWSDPARRKASWLSPTTRRFLEVERDVSSASAWNDSDLPKLWLYNLHYFDDLCASNAGERSQWHAEEIARWIAQNPAGHGNGWEPYTLSLRIVNWIKWAQEGNQLHSVMQHSLAVQARYLRENIEHHLLGNHILANAKALIFAGCYFEGAEATAWLLKGLSILQRELPEQVFSDGGHFERSPMYHSIILEDLLDLCNLASCYADSLPMAALDQEKEWKSYARIMRRWLVLMTHPDGEIALFNDSAFGIAPAPEELHAYARRLGLGPCPVPSDGIHLLGDSGYVRLQKDQAIAILDVGEIGPGYLPGHAHADSLGFELSICGERFLVDSGTSLYEAGEERLRQRGTGAHNTVLVDEEDSSQVWSSFRVARRAVPHELVVQEEADLLRVSCGHDGYMRLPGRVFHTRSWRLENGRLAIHDQLDGRYRSAAAHLHMHPRVKHLSPGCYALPEVSPICLESTSGPGELQPSTWHPRFGISQPNTRLRIALSGPELRSSLTW